MKKDWEYKTLKEISIIYGNYGLSVSSIPYNGVRYLRITDITENGELNDDKVSADISSGKTQEELQEGDILFARTGATVGKTLIYRKEFGKCLFAGYLIRYRLNKDIVIPQFIHHFTHSSGYYKWVSSNQKAAAQPNIGAKIYNELRIPVPPLSEQKEIVEYLDSSFAKIDKLKENAAKNLEEAKALFQSALKDALEPKEGWEEKMLKELTNKISDGSHNPPTGLSYSEYRMLSSKNVRNDNFSFDNPRYLSEDDFQKENKRTQLEKGDVLLTIVGAGLGDCCVYNFDDVIVFQRSVSVLKPNYDKITSRFLMYSLQFRYDDIRKKSNGAAQKGIYLKQLAAYSLKLPSIKEQQSIVSHLDSINEKVNTLQQNYSRICDECDALKQAILRQVFE